MMLTTHRPWGLRRATTTTALAVLVCCAGFVGAFATPVRPGARRRGRFAVALAVADRGDDAHVRRRESADRRERRLSRAAVAHPRDHRLLPSRRRPAGGGPARRGAGEQRRSLRPHRVRARVQRHPGHLPRAAPALGVGRLRRRRADLPAEQRHVTVRSGGRRRVQPAEGHELRHHVGPRRLARQGHAAVGARGCRAHRGGGSLERRHHDLWARRQHEAARPAHRRRRHPRRHRGRSTPRGSTTSRTCRRSCSSTGPKTRRSRTARRSPASTQHAVPRACSPSRTATTGRRRRRWSNPRPPTSSVPTCAATRRRVTGCPSTGRQASAR